ncbi:MAG: thioester reductase domain-containing protein, partial [Proteobacteria bacterium]|nr:thioester reductase domain-containing protein [Pseudomonadota bacterium]
YYLELLLTKKFGSALTGIIRNEIDSLKLVSKEISPFLEQFYYNSYSFNVFCDFVRLFMENLLKELPQGRKLRILEVGAGTGGLTSHLVSLLSLYNVEYTFTDISLSYTQKAETIYKEYDWMEYDIFDMNKSPAEQGFEPYSYDIILASSVLHATKDIKYTLKNLKHLLVTDGCLLLIEVVLVTYWVNLVFGTLPGWWAFKDKDVRPEHPILTEPRWIEILKSCGYKTPVPISENNDHSPLSIILAKAPDTDGEKAEVRAAKLLQLKKDEAKGPILLFSPSAVDKKGLQSYEMDSYFETTYVFQGDFYSSRSRTTATTPFNEAGYLEILDNLGSGINRIPDIVFFNTSSESATTGINENEISSAADQFLSLIRAITKKYKNQSCSIWNITQNTQPFLNKGTQNLNHAVLWSISRVAMNEYPKLKIRSVDLSVSPSRKEIHLLLEELLTAGNEDEILIKNDNRYVNRLIARRDFKPVSEHQNFALFKQTDNSLDSFSFRETSRPEPAPNQIEIRVKTAALNFKDHAKAVGIVRTKFDDSALISGFGYEFSGIVERTGSGIQNFKVGEEVIGMGWNGMSRYVLTVPERLVSKPPKLSFEAASTLPLVFITAYYSLYKLANLKKGESVLIHTAAGGVGLAVVQMALQLGAKVYATAGTKEKRTYLKLCGVHEVSDSRSLVFEDDFRNTEGFKGIDVVINTLPDKAIDKSISLLKPFRGRFVDISNLHNESTVSIQSFRKGGALFVFDLEKLAEEQPEEFSRLFLEVNQMFLDGALSPIPYQVIQPYDVKRAFKLLNTGNHIGKICISMQNCSPQVAPTATNPEIDRSGTYIVAGGLGGFGIEVAKWLVNSGAKYLILIGRSGVHTQDVKDTLEEMEQQGVTLAIIEADITKKNELNTALNNCFEHFPPVKGVIHSAMVLDIAIIEEMTKSRFTKVTDPKILGSWNLYELTRHFELDFFMAFSSVNSILGFAGQSNYSSANYFLDLFAEYLRKQGVPGISISWGVLDEAGYFTKHGDDKEHFKKEGFFPISLLQTQRAMKHAMERNLTHVAVFPLKWNLACKYHPIIANSPRLSHFIKHSETDDGSEETNSIRDIDSLMDCSSEERFERISELVRKALSEVLGVRMQGKDDDQSFDRFSLDSLLAVELGVSLNDYFHIDLPKVTILQKGLNVQVLSKIIEQEILRNEGLSEKSDDKAILVETIPIIELQDEAKLPLDIRPQSTVSQYNTDPTSIFLTGGSGFLGAYLLSDLLRISNAQIYCLVRSADEAVGLKRLMDNLQDYNLWQSEFASRIRAIPGDLEKPGLGLNQDNWNYLADEIDVIYHNGAWLNFAQPYQVMKPANVKGTVEIIRLACDKRTKTLHYISTLSKLAQTAPDPGSLVENKRYTHAETVYDQDYINRNGFNVGYHQSKWVADELVTEASKRGVPTTIFRPSLISGERKTGVWNHQDYICMLLKGLIQMGKAPLQDAYFDFAPVDYYSQAIVALSRKEDSLNKGFLLKNPRPIKWNDFINWFSTKGYPMKLMDSEEWLSEFKGYIKTNPE